MKEYQITGMSCASCQAHVTKAVEQVAGVTSVNVSLLSNSMQVEGNADEKAVIAAVKDAGYGASLKGKQQSQQDPYEDRETPELLKRLKYSIGFLTVLMYFSMGHMLSLPVPSFLEHNPVGNGIIQMTLAMIVLMINRKFFVSGWKALRHGSSNMDTLVALGSGISFIYSFLVLLQMSGMEHEGAMAAVHSLYFETAAMIPSLITVGKTMESLSKGKTTSALRQLISLAPKTAVVLRDGQEVTVDADQLQVNDLFVVRAGESVAADGVIVQGSAGFDESSLTGESVPVDKQAGDSVMATSINTSGHVVVKAHKVGKDTGFSRIIELVAQASDSKAPIARIADRVSGIFVPSIILIATVVLAGWLIAGAPLENALTHGLRNVRRKDKKLLIRSEHIGENLVITVRDNGAGMDAEAMNRLLEQNDMKRVETGVSIGILNVNARLKKLFGKEYGLHIESTVGEGTTVTITVPAVSENDTEHSDNGAE